MWTVNTFAGITADLSQEAVRRYAKNISPYPSLANMLERFAGLDVAYVRTFLERRGYGNNLFTIRMLEAHGQSNQEIGFQYADLQDGKLVWYSVDDWLDRYEGKDDVLYISCCNEGKVILSPRKSILIYPLGIYSPADLINEAKGESVAELIKVENRR